jgi:hypothetical protein
MIRLVNHFTGFNSAFELQQDSFEDYSIVAESEQSSHGRQYTLKNGLTIVHMFDEQGVINAWNSVIFRSKVGSAILALTSVAILVGGIRSIQNKSSNKILAAISTCFFINVGLLLTTFAGWRRAGINILEMQNSSRLAFEGIVIKVNSFRDEVLRDGLKALYYYPGPMAVFSRDELIGILKNLKDTYKEVWDRSNPVPNSFGEFLSQSGELIKTYFLTLPEDHPVGQAILAMLSAFGSFDKSRFRLMNSLKVNFLDHVKDDGNHSYVEILNDASLAEGLDIETFQYLAHEKLYDFVIEILQKGKQIDGGKVPKNKLNYFYMFEFYTNFFVKVCSGKDQSFVKWLEQKINIIKTDNKNFFIKCFMEAKALMPKQ